MGHERDFAAEVAVLEARMAQERAVAVARLRALHEAWARALLGVEDDGDLVRRVRAVVERGTEPRRAIDAIEQLLAAEKHQWEIGTWASGSGEGLSSMAEVRRLQIAQAWLWSALSSRDGDAADKARELLKGAVEDPNRVARRYSKQIQALYKRLGNYSHSGTTATD